MGVESKGSRVEKGVGWPVGLTLPLGPPGNLAPSSAALPFDDTHRQVLQRKLKNTRITQAYRRDTEDRE